MNTYVAEILTNSGMSTSKKEFTSIPSEGNFVIVVRGYNGQLYGDTYRYGDSGNLEALVGGYWTDVREEGDFWIPSDGFSSVVAIIREEVLV